MVVLLILFLALNYWPSDVPSNAIYNVSPQYWNSKFSVTRGLVFSIIFSAQKLETFETPLTNQTIDILLASEFWFSEMQKIASTFDLSRHAKSFFSAITGFISSPKSTSKEFRFWGVILLVTILCVTCDWRLLVHKSHEVFFNMGSSQFSKPGFLHNNNSLDVFLQSLILMLATSVRKIVKEVGEIVTSCGILKDQGCQKVLVVLTELGIQTFTSLNLPISFSSIQVPIAVVLYLKWTVRN